MSVSRFLTGNEQYNNMGLILISVLTICHGADHELSAKAGKIITH